MPIVERKLQTNNEKRTTLYAAVRSVPAFDLIRQTSRLCGVTAATLNARGLIVVDPQHLQDAIYI